MADLGKLPDPEDESLRIDHLDHCIDMLRQNVMCSADVDRPYRGVLLVIIADMLPDHTVTVRLGQQAEQKCRGGQSIEDMSRFRRY
jgi:hypothetical protein